MKIIKEDDNINTYLLGDEKIRISLEDSSIRVEDSKGIKVGGFEFACIEEEWGYYYKITNMFMDDKCASYQNKGIGEECLRFFKRYYDCPIVAGEDSGTTSEDGSHLTGAGASFIDKMRRLKIVAPSRYEKF